MSPIPSRLIVASRASRLARLQAHIVAGFVERARPGLEVDLRAVSTKGDRDGRGFAEIGAKGIFVAEIEREVLEGRADVAVHSAKDLTAELAPGCSIVCVPPRARVVDVVVGGDRAAGTGEERIAALPPGAVVGTSSMRRRALLAEARADLEVTDFRGNLDTRLAKLADGVVGAAILAAAGIDRLAPEGVSAAALDPAWWVPAPGQGALAVEARSERSDLVELFAGLSDTSAWTEVACERAFSGRLEGGCSVPLGCLARAEEDRLVVTGYLGSPDGSHALRDRISGSPQEADDLGRELAEAILAAGGVDILADIGASDVVEPSEP